MHGQRTTPGREVPVLAQTCAAAGERTDANKEKAISFAARRCLADLFPTEVASFNALMEALVTIPAITLPI